MSSPRSDDEYSWEGEKVEEYIDPSLRVATHTSAKVALTSYTQSVARYAASMLSWKREEVEIELLTRETDREVCEERVVPLQTPEVTECLNHAISRDRPASCPIMSDDDEVCESVQLSESPEISDATPVCSSHSMDSSSSSSSWAWVSMQPGQAELSVESALLWCLNPAIYGIKSIGVPSASDRALRLIESCKGDTSAAVVLASSNESGGVKRTRIIFEFLLRQVPFVGCPAYILTSTWTHLRSVAVIAAIYGHDVESGRTQHEILWCLIPPGEDSSSSGGMNSSSHSISATAKTVSQILISTAIKRTLGIGMVTDLFQLGADLWTAGKKKNQDEEDYEYIELGPAATARNYFCPESDFSKYRLAAYLVGFILPLLFRVPLLVMGVGLLVLVAGFVARKKNSRLRAMEMINYREFLPKIASYLVFSLHALIPVWSISSGVTLAYFALFGEGSLANRLGGVVLSAIALSNGLRGAGIVPDTDLAKAIHVEIRRMVIIVGVIFHLFPLIDIKGEYTKRLSWFTGDNANPVMKSHLHFLSIIASNWFQQLLLVELKKREVILRLLGAERVMVLSMTLFFRGITAAVTSDKLVPLFRQITPHPIFCCIVMSLRRFAWQAGVLMSAIPLVPVWFPTNSVVGLVSGMAAGTLVVVTLWNDWRTNENTYLSHMRLLYILPGMVTGKTKQVVDQMIMASGKSVMKNFIVSYAKRVAQQFNFKISS